MDRRMLAFGLGTFHTLLFFVLLLLGLHLGEGLDVLLALGTGPGILVFLAFWAITLWATAMALDGIFAGRNPLEQAGLWGAAEGFGSVVVALVVLSFIGGPMVFTALPLAGGVGMVLGIVVGLLFAGIDRVLLDLSFATLRDTGPAPGPLAAQDAQEPAPPRNTDESAK